MQQRLLYQGPSSESSNPGANHNPGVLAASQNANSGANSGTAAPAANRNSNPNTGRGNSLNNNMMVSSDSTMLSRKGSTQKGKQNVGVRRKSRKNFKPQSGRKYEKQIQAIKTLKNKGLIVQYNRSTDNLAEFVKTQVDKTKVRAVQTTVGNDTIALTGMRTEGADVDPKKAFADKRNDIVRKFMTNDAIRGLDTNQWAEANNNNIYKLYELFVSNVGYFIDFSNLDPIDFKERTIKVPTWLGLKEFALRYSKPIVRYPGILIRLLSEKDWSGFERYKITNIIVKIKSLLFGYFENDAVGTRIYHQGIATQLKLRMYNVDKTAEAAFKLVDSLVTCFKNANTLTLAFNAVNAQPDSFDSRKLNAFKNITAEIGKIIESDTINNNLAVALGRPTARNVIEADEELRQETVMNADADVDKHKDENPF
jgi:hypothetical protein